MSLGLNAYVPYSTSKCLLTFKSINFIMRSIFNLSLILTFVFCAQGLFAQANTSLTTSSGVVAENAKESKGESEMFNNYTWLKEMVDVEKCKGTKVTLRSSSKNPIHKFILVEQADGPKILYSSKGKRYCTDNKKLNCVDFYELDTEEDAFECK